jgi:hypothetical protein
MFLKSSVLFSTFARLPTGYLYWRVLGLLLLPYGAAPLTWGQSAGGDSTAAPALPFNIHPTKRLDDDEIANKKEGVFVTGLPHISADPVRGFGAGGQGFVYFNGKRSDPFFPWTAYRHKISADVFYSVNGAYTFSANYDAPYLFNKPWRMRANAVFVNNPNAQYWGMGAGTLRPLSFFDKSGGTYGERRTFRRFQEYEENLALAVATPDGRYVTDALRHDFRHREQLYNVLLEHVALGGRLRFMVGYEALFTRFTDYSGQVTKEPVENIAGERIDNAINNESLIREHIRDGTWDRFNLIGFEDKWSHTSILGLAVIYDTRDFEPDPSKGIFAEYSHEISMPLFGSPFRQQKYMAQLQYFWTPLRWRQGRSRLTLAGLGAIGQVFGSRINFIELFDLSSQSEAGGVGVLGGERSLRGYRETRLMAPIIIMCNLEARARLYDFRLLSQHFGLGVCLFYDFGSPAERYKDIRFSDFRGAPGIGGRLIWNRSTVIRADLGFGTEATQFFLGFGHIF